MTDLDPALHQLALAYGIAVEYWDWQGQHVPVASQTVVDVLAGLQVDASSPEAAAEALHTHQELPWTRMLPPCVAMRQGSAYDVNVHVADGASLGLRIDLEGGGVRDQLEQRENGNPARSIGDRWVGEATFRIPADLPLGYHTLHAQGGGEDASMTIIVTPGWLGFPATMGERRGWGLATQLYSVRSQQSWGAGDLADLTDLAVWSAAEHGADYVLINPLHAAEPVAPMEPSPYLPTTRRFANPIYLRVERLTEYATALEADLDVIAGLLSELRSDPDLVDRVARDAIWAAKRAALTLIHAVPRTAGREAAYGAYLAREGDGLEAYATWCALAQVHGADWSVWPEALQHPDSAEVDSFRETHARVALTRGRCRTSTPRASPSGRRRMRTTRTVRTGPSRRGDPISSPRSRTPPSARWCPPCCAMRAAFGWTTSSVCSACGGFPPVRRPPRGHTCATTTTL